MVAAFARVLAATEAAQRELDELDALAGDGDHGVTMVLGWRAVCAALAAEPPASPGAALRTAAAAFADVGGSAGPLWGTALLRAGRTLGDRQLDTANLADAAEAAVAGMQERGRCSVGDRTVVDAMAPAATALRAAATRGATVEDALLAAAAGASTGAEATTAMIPRRGRAARAPDRVSGRQDAGARVAAIFWASLSPS